MNKDQGIGAVILVASIVGIVVYAWLLFTYAIVVLQITAFIAVAACACHRGLDRVDNGYDARHQRHWNLSRQQRRQPEIQRIQKRSDLRLSPPLVVTDPKRGAIEVLQSVASQHASD